MELVKIIMMQTNYSHEEAAKKLRENNNDYMKVIEEYIVSGEKIKKDEVKVPYHQAKLRLFGNELDIAERKYEEKKATQK